MPQKKKSRKKLALSKSIYHKGIPQQHLRDQSERKKLATWGPFKQDIYRQVRRKSAACRRKSRAQYAKKLRLTVKQLASQYPNQDVHHRHRMTWSFDVHGNVDLKCDRRGMTLVDRNANRGSIRDEELKMKGYTFDEQYQRSWDIINGKTTIKRSKSLTEAKTNGIKVRRGKFFGDFITHGELKAARAKARIIDPSGCHFDPPISRKRIRHNLQRITQLEAYKSYSIVQIRDMNLQGVDLTKTYSRPNRASASYSKPNKPKVSPVILYHTSTGVTHVVAGAEKIKTAIRGGRRVIRVFYI